MTPRQRVQRAVNHQVPDRVPIDLGGMKASGIAASAYDKVKRKLGIPGRTKVIDTRFMIAAVENEVLRRLHVDVVPLDLSIVLAMVRPDHEWIAPVVRRHGAAFPAGDEHRRRRRGQLDPAGGTDGSPSSFRMPRGGHYFDDVSFNRGDRIDPAKFRPVSDIPDEHLAILGRYAQRLYENTDYAILGWGFGVCFLGLSG